jgi:hypothetical protein
MNETSELRERLARMKDPSTNGGSGAFVPSEDDLDWFLFNSFPDCEVTPARFVELLPVYERALRAGSAFDTELLFVRMLEMGEPVTEDARASLACVAGERVLSGSLDSADAIAAVRFIVRTHPDPGAFLDHLLRDPALARLRWQITLDFVLDERSLDDYLAVSYLRDADPDAGPRLAGHPVSRDAWARLTEWLDPEASRRRLEQGFASFAETEEREGLREALRERAPGFNPPT